MGNKGIAIRTILLLLIGVLVAGLLIYFVYRYFTTSGLSREECRARALSWCTSCWNAMTAKGSACDGWDDGGTTCEVGPTPSPELQSCADDYYDGDLTGATNCEGATKKTFCRNFIPIS